MAKRAKPKRSSRTKEIREQRDGEADLVETLLTLQRSYEAAKAADDGPSALRAVTRMRALLPDRPEIRFVEAQLRHDKFFETERPIELLEPILDQLPNQHAGYELLSSIQMARGEMEAAWDAGQRAVELDPRAGVAYINLIKIDKVRAAAFEPQIRDALKGENIQPLHAGFLLNALGRLREAAKDYDGAWSCFAAAKKVAPSAQFDMDASEAILEEGKAVFSPSFLAERRRWGVSDERPVFVVGLPRSGTTLIERTLAAHPAIAGAGELDAIGVINKELAARAAELTQKRVGRYAHLLDLTPNAARKAAMRYLSLAQETVNAPEAKRIVDKMPSNFVHLGLISILFPKARIIHVSRNRLDVFVSNFKEMFRFAQPQSYDPMRFAHYAILYEEIMDHWRARLGDQILEVRYEDLVENFEPEARRMVEHIGLDWDPACAAPHKAEGVVMTASMSQVREPVNARSVGGWRRYERQLQDLKSVMDRYFATKEELGAPAPFGEDAALDAVEPAYAAVGLRAASHAGKSSIDGNTASA